jgi:hypothetical protein
VSYASLNSSNPHRVSAGLLSTCLSLLSLDILTVEKQLGIQNSLSTLPLARLHCFDLFPRILHPLQVKITLSLLSCTILQKIGQKIVSAPKTKQRSIHHFKLGLWI